jgi:hypothetical protein
MWCSGSNSGISQHDGRLDPFPSHGRRNMSTTKLFCVRKGNQYVAWNGKTMMEKPHEGIRVSRMLAKQKYSGYETIPFPEAYEQWF